MMAFATTSHPLLAVTLRLRAVSGEITKQLSMKSFHIKKWPAMSLGWVWCHLVWRQSLICAHWCFLGPMGCCVFTCQLFPYLYDKMIIKHYEYDYNILSCFIWAVLLFGVWNVTWNSILTTVFLPGWWKQELFLNTLYEQGLEEQGLQFL